VQYLEGGLESAFEHVERNVYTTRLLHLKGRKNIRIRTVPCVRGSLNEGDVFILDAGFTVFVWNGKEASRQEKMKATHVAQNIKDRERGGKARIVLLDEDDVDHAKDWVTFWELLGGKGPVAPAVDDDAEVHTTPLRLACCSLTFLA
jgi:advillin